MHQTTTSSAFRSRVLLGAGRLFISATILLSFAPLALVAQEAAAPATEGAAPAAGGHGHGTKTWIDKFKLGGWVMYPCVGFSVLTVWLSVDLWIRCGAKKLAPDAHVNGAKDHFRMGDYVGAYQFAKNNPSGFSDTVRVSLSYVGDGQEATENAMYGELNKVNASLTTRINYLSVIGVCTPMIGLLGTVTGMITAFEVLGSSGIGDPTGLSKAIGEVLVATASGLLIAIPAFTAYYWLRNRGAKTLHDLQDTVIH